MTDSTTPAQSEAKNTVAEAKDYLKNFDGSIAHKSMSLGCTVMKQIFKREAPLCQRNSLYITFFARLIFSADVIDKVEDHLLDRIKELKKELNADIEHNQAILNNGDVFSISSNSKQDDFEADFASPMYRSFLELLQMGDTLSSIYNTMWHHDLIRSRDYQVRRMALKKAIRAINTDIRNAWIALVKRAPDEKAAKLELINAKKNRKKPTTDVAVAAATEINDSQAESATRNVDSTEQSAHNSFEDNAVPA